MKKKKTKDIKCTIKNKIELSYSYGLFDNQYILGILDLKGPPLSDCYLYFTDLKSKDIDKMITMLTKVAKRMKEKE